MILALLSVIFSLVAIGTGLLRWRMHRIYWHTHPGGSEGYRRDCLLLAAPLVFIAIGIAVSIDLAFTFGIGVFIFIAPFAAAAFLTASVLPPFQRASQRLIDARAPLGKA